MAAYRNGSELLVRFSNGLRFRRPRHEFVQAGQMLMEPAPTLAISYEAPAPMPKTQLEARQLIESLRVGIAPTQHVAERGMLFKGAPALVRLMEKIAARFGLVVEEKIALEMIPAIGAISGALINTIFIGHFQNTARGHFIIKRLEAKHGLEEVRRAYEAL